MILGMDMGTSSVKALLYDGKEVTASLKAGYEDATPLSFIKAIRRIVEQAGNDEIDCIGFSSQVGSYVIDGTEVLSWNDPRGKEELDEVLKTFSQDVFLTEIGMPHPKIHSYPIPRIRYLMKHKDKIQSLCQVKDYVIHELTGNYVSDVFSWRGLANKDTKCYSRRFLDYLHMDASILPKLCSPCEIIGEISEKGSKLSGLKKGTKVCLGLNDFYASLMGIGLEHDGDLFDITGSSEHLGILSHRMLNNENLVSSPFFVSNVHYGVTASSGACFDFAIKNFDLLNQDLSHYKAGKNTPIFLPYLNGERSPVYDPDARGVFFGISGKTDQTDLAYSVCEGVCFSLKHIFDGVVEGIKPNKLIITNGASRDAFLNQMKANILGVKAITLTIQDTSAFGALCCALAGIGAFHDPFEASKKLNQVRQEYLPQKEFQFDNERFALYKKIYLDLKNEFAYFGRN